MFKFPNINPTVLPGRILSNKTAVSVWNAILHFPRISSFAVCVRKMKHDFKIGYNLRNTRRRDEH